MSEDRLNALKRAEWRARMKKGGYGHCRICRGRTDQQRPYCERHFSLLNGYRHLLSASAKGENLDACDDLIRLRIMVHLRHDPLIYENYLIGTSMSLRNANTGWKLFLMRPGPEVELGHFQSMPEVLAYVREHYQDWSSRNRFAKKAMIR